MLSRRSVLGGIIASPLAKLASTLPVREIQSGALASDEVSLAELVIGLVGEDDGQMWRSAANRFYGKVMRESAAPGADARAVLSRYFGEDVLSEYDGFGVSVPGGFSRLVVTLDGCKGCENGILVPYPEDEVVTVDSTMVDQIT
jgi:hypothetical protein